MSHSFRVWPPNNDPSVLSNALPCCRELFFRWCNDTTHICCDICAGKVIFWKVRSPSDKIHISSCLCLSWTGCPWITCWGWLRDRGQIKWVLWLAWTTALERNRCCSLAHTDVPMAGEPRDWWSEDTTALGGSSLDGRHVCGHGGWPRQREGRGTGGLMGVAAENRPPGSRASKAGLTESIWTTVNRRQPVCWLPLSRIFTGSFPTNTCCPARLSKGASARVFPPT